MLAADSRLKAAYDGMGRLAWSREWEELFGYDSSSLLDLPAGAWLRYETDGGLRQGLVSLSRYLVQGLEDDDYGDNKEKAEAGGGEAPQGGFEKA